MERISWKSWVMPMSAVELAYAVTTLHDAMAADFGKPMKVVIQCYSGLPYTSNFLHDDGVEEWMASENAKRVFATFSSPADPGYKEAFDKAVYVRAVVSPVETGERDTTFGSIDAKGNAPRVLAFYVQGNCDDVACEAVITKVRAARHVGMRLGDGYEDHT
ncbi:MAG: hypothetical protein GC134_05965 [Proteobacteria bacterium]|nr:hypothetical protein [Pseudomonadota bacterium]